MSYPTEQGTAVEGVPYREAQSCLGPVFAGSFYKFFLSGTSTPANVYQDGALTTVFATSGVITADAFGRFPAIYLDPSVIYRVQFFDSTNSQRWQVDPYTSQLATVGTSSLSAFGFQISTTGEVTIPAPNAGGTGTALTLKAGTIGSAALEISSPLPGNSALVINSSVTTGGQTATFIAINKPGTSSQGALTVTATVAPPNGAGYVGGNLTAVWTGATASTYIIQLSTGQLITGATFTNGVVAFTTPATTISGGPTATFNVGQGATQANVTPAGWLPITCDGVQYYTPIWHGNNFTPYVATPTALGEVIVGSSFTLGGTGLTTVVGGTATPANWFVPVATGVGAGYYINIAKTGGLSGINFADSVTATVAPSGGAYVGGNLTSNWVGETAATYTITLNTGQVISGCTFTNGNVAFVTPATVIVGAPTAVILVAVQGHWVNITSSGLTITSNAQSQVTGTYQLATTITGSTVVAAGTVTLSNNNGVQSPTINGATPLILSGNGTSTLNAVSTTNWFLPTTSNVGAGFWINISQTGGTSGYTFSAASGAWTQITNGGLTIGISGSGSALFNVSGSYLIAADSAGVNQVGSGSITLTGSNVQSPNWSGTTPLFLAGNGSATLNSIATSDWLTPNLANSGSLFWINVTRTGGTTASVIFSAAQGSWTNITNSGLSIGMSGYSNIVGTANVTGTWQISSASGGTPVLGSGSISLSISGLTVLHVYTTAGAGTETIPTGATTVVIEAFSGVSGGGGGSLGNGFGGGGGGGGCGPSYSRSTYTVTGHIGQTMAYTVGAAGAAGAGIFNGTAGNGTAGGTSTVSSGTFVITTMTDTAGGGGQGGTNVAGGAGGTVGSATGGNVTNTNGGVGGAGGSKAAGGAPGTAGSTGTPVNCSKPTAAGNNIGGSGNLGNSGVAGSVGVVCFKYT